MFLKISQNSQENACARVSQACNFVKKETRAQEFSCEFCEIFKSTVFTEHLGTTAYIIIIDVITHLKALSFYKLYLIILWNT